MHIHTIDIFCLLPNTRGVMLQSILYDNLPDEVWFEPPSSFEERPDELFEEEYPFFDDSTLDTARLDKDLVFIEEREDFVIDLTAPCPICDSDHLETGSVTSACVHKVSVLPDYVYRQDSLHDCLRMASLLRNKSTFIAEEESKLRLFFLQVNRPNTEGLYHGYDECFSEAFSSRLSVLATFDYRLTGDDRYNEMRKPICISSNAEDSINCLIRNNKYQEHFRLTRWSTDFEEINRYQFPVTNGFAGVGNDFDMLRRMPITEKFKPVYAYNRNADWLPSNWVYFKHNRSRKEVFFPNSSLHRHIGIEVLQKELGLSGEIEVLVKNMATFPSNGKNKSLVSDVFGNVSWNTQRLFVAVYNLGRGVHVSIVDTRSSHKRNPTSMTPVTYSSKEDLRVWARHTYIPFRQQGWICPDCMVTSNLAKHSFPTGYVVPRVRVTPEQIDAMRHIIKNTRGEFWFVLEKDFAN